VNIVGEYPIVYWRLAEAAAVGTAYDSNANDFSIYPRIASTSMTAVTQGAASFLAHSQSATFAGASSSQIVFPNNTSLQTTGDMSVEFWVNFSSFGTPSTTYALITKNVTSSLGAGEFEVYMFNNAGSGAIAWDQNNTFTASAVGALSTATWYHIVIARDGTAKTIKFYINGTLTATQTYTNVPTTTTGTVIIGATSGIPTASYSMTEVAIYRKPLTQAQVTSHHSWGAASDATATAYGGATALYGLIPYPAYGAPTTAVYSNPSTLWGTFQWK
jgi:Concanavalin A-like lectin/glucanases superfamily